MGRSSLFIFDHFLFLLVLVRDPSPLHSFLQPSIFPLRPKTLTPPQSPPPKTQPTKTLTLESQSHLESAPQSSFSTHQTDEAWQPFRILASSHLPSPHLSNSLILHLSYLNDRLNLKRAFAAAVLPIERSSGSLSFETLKPLFQSFNSRDISALAFALIKTLLKNRIFLPFSMWDRELAQLSSRSGGFAAFLKVFEENCRVCLDEKVDAMRLDLGSCNEVLGGCCRELGSASDAERVMEIMSSLGLSPDLRVSDHLLICMLGRGMRVGFRSFTS